MTMIQEMIQVATEWRDFSIENRGRRDASYGDDFVRCYFLTSDNYSSINIGKFREEFQVCFHPTVVVSNISLSTERNYPIIIAKARELLAAEKERVAAMGETELQQLQAEKIAFLKAELAKVEGGAL